MTKPARILTFKCAKCAKPVKVFLQKVSACSHIQPKRYATGSKDAVESFMSSADGSWTHHH
jgi:hypothetical protein